VLVGLRVTALPQTSPQTSKLGQRKEKEKKKKREEKRRKEKEREEEVETRNRAEAKTKQKKKLQRMAFLRVHTSLTLHEVSYFRARSSRQSLECPARLESLGLAVRGRGRGRGRGREHSTTQQLQQHEHVCVCVYVRVCHDARRLAPVPADQSLVYRWRECPYCPVCLVVW
jgi:hypothetical protein